MSSGQPHSIALSFLLPTRNAFIPSLRHTVEKNNLAEFNRIISTLNHDDLTKTIINLEFEDPLIHYLTRHGRKEMIKSLLSETRETAIINSKNPSYQTPLICAVIMGNDDMIDFLLERNAEVDTIDRSERTALIYAIQKSKNNPNTFIKIIKKLLAKGANPNIVTTYPPPLFQTTNPDILTLLLENGADPNYKNTADVDNTALSTYFYPYPKREQIANINILLNHGANPNLFNLTKRNPVLLNLERQEFHLLAQLLSHAIKFEDFSQTLNILLTWLQHNDCPSEFRQQTLKCLSPHLIAYMQLPHFNPFKRMNKDGHLLAYQLTQIKELYDGDTTAGEDIENLIQALYTSTQKRSRAIGQAYDFLMLEDFMPHEVTPKPEDVDAFNNFKIRFHDHPIETPRKAFLHGFHEVTGPTPAERQLQLHETYNADLKRCTNQIRTWIKDFKPNNPQEEKSKYYFLNDVIEEQRNDSAPLERFWSLLLTGQFSKNEKDYLDLLNCFERLVFLGEKYDNTPERQQERAQIILKELFQLARCFEGILTTLTYTCELLSEIPMVVMDLNLIKIIEEEWINFCAQYLSYEYEPHPPKEEILFALGLFRNWPKIDQFTLGLQKIVTPQRINWIAQRILVRIYEYCRQKEQDEVNQLFQDWRSNFNKEFPEQTELLDLNDPKNMTRLADNIPRSYTDQESGMYQFIEDVFYQDEKNQSYQLTWRTPSEIEHTTKSSLTAWCAKNKKFKALPTPQEEQAIIDVICSKTFDPENLTQLGTSIKALLIIHDLMLANRLTNLNIDCLLYTNADQPCLLEKILTVPFINLKKLHCWGAYLEGYIHTEDAYYVQAIQNLLARLILSENGSPFGKDLKPFKNYQYYPNAFNHWITCLDNFLNEPSANTTQISKAKETIEDYLFGLLEITEIIKGLKQIFAHAKLQEFGRILFINLVKHWPNLLIDKDLVKLIRIYELTEPKFFNEEISLMDHLINSNNTLALEALKEHGQILVRERIQNCSANLSGNKRKKSEEILSDGDESDITTHKSKRTRTDTECSEDLDNTSSSDDLNDISLGQETMVFLNQTLTSPTHTPIQNPTI